MAKPPAPAPNAPAAPAKGPSMVIQLVVLLALTGVAAGIGLFAGNYLTASVPAAGQEEPHDAAEAGGHGKPEKPLDPAEEDLKRGVVALQPITTNLAGSGETWVRMEVSAVFEKEADPSMADVIHQDLLAYLRTVKLHQVEGASGFQHLKTDMEDRARIRSQGKVSAILIKTLLFE